MLDTFNPTPAGSDLERRARRRASAKMGWYIHALVYTCVNAGLALISWRSGGPWLIYPLAGWGLGLAIHGLVVWLTIGGGLYERLLQAERDKQRRHTG